MEQTIETKICQLCSASFDIAQADLDFLEKLSPKINGKIYPLPKPEFCPDCRQKQRLSFYNERNLYKRTSDFSAKPMISMYSPDKMCKVYEQKEWWGDSFDGINYGRVYKSEVPFFLQFDALNKEVPKTGLLTVNCENCEFNNALRDSKDCYLCFSSTDLENSHYASSSRKLKDCLDCWWSGDMGNCYEIFNCARLYHCFFCAGCGDCSNLYFSEECTNCHDCLFCYGLVNKKYHIFNQPYSKEEYEKELSKYTFFTQESIIQYKKIATDFIAKIPHRFSHEDRNENCSGDYSYGNKNCHNCFGVTMTEDSRWICEGGRTKNSYDCSILYDGEGHSVGSVSTENSQKVYFSFDILDSSDIYYSTHLHNCKFCFGCAGLKHKSYCILNKQYTKEEYEQLVPQIIEHMQHREEWGQFFPSFLSPFGYNETMAQEYFPLVREEVIGVPVETKDFSSGFSAQSSTPVETRFIASDSVSRGLLHGPTFNWSDYEAPFPQVEKIIPADKLPNDISKIPDDILNWAIQCEITKKPFRIVKQELDFYRKHNLPIPHKHPDQRHLERIAMRNPRKLFSRKCDKCGIEMQTTYSPDRPEKVYCEGCYNEEVY